jgi:hypothetical protein
MTPLTEAAARLSRAVIALKKRREKDALARKHQKKIAAFFRAQKGTVLDRMKDQEYLFSESFRRLSEKAIIDFTLQNWDRIWEVIANGSDGDLQKIIFEAEADGVIRGADQLKKAIPLFDKKSSFNLANPRAVQFFMQTGGSVEKIRGIQQVTGDEIQNIIGNAIDKGWSYNETAKKISTTFDGFSRDRAKTIAVNEIAIGYEGGNRLFAQSLQDDNIILEKKYQTSEDDKVSDLCQGNQDEGWIPLDQYHQSGVMNPPGHVNCRCYEIYQEVRKE